MMHSEQLRMKKGQKEWGKHRGVWRGEEENEAEEQRMKQSEVKGEEEIQWN